MISIVIPARNEAPVIARTLAALTSSSGCEEFEIIVVCNGCNDDTAAVARRFGPKVRVLETEQAGKVHALNLGDQAVSGFPRVYVDADVVVTAETIRALAKRLEQGDILAIAPRPSVNLECCSRFVCAYYDIKFRLPSAREGIGGSGVYAMSEAGRLRFGKFPNVVSDDGYVRIQFKPSERATLDCASSMVFAPRTIVSLIHIRSRAHFGTVELQTRYPDLWENSGQRNHKAILRFIKSPSLWWNLIVYTYVNLVARYRAILRFQPTGRAWERDNTSRPAVLGTSSNSQGTK